MPLLTHTHTQYAVRSQVEMHGLDPSECIVFMKPKAVSLIICDDHLDHLDQLAINVNQLG